MTEAQETAEYVKELGTIFANDIFTLINQVFVSIGLAIVALGLTACIVYGGWYLCCYIADKIQGIDKGI